jgi:deazaflavin-dependent oxidoreductase (nitroreductase family)
MEVMTMSRPMTSAGADTRRPLLGLRRKPGRLALMVFRLPLKAYQHNAGPAVGRTFVAFTHIGRTTGRRYQTVAMVARYDKATGEVAIVAGWGPQTDWYRNLQAHPAVTVQLGGQTFTPHQRFLSEEEAFDVVVQFRREHPHRLRFFSTVLGWGDLRDDARVREFVSMHPFVAFRPLPIPPPEAPTEP